MGPGGSSCGDGERRQRAGGPRRGGGAAAAATAAGVSPAAAASANGAPLAADMAPARAPAGRRRYGGAAAAMLLLLALIGQSNGAAAAAASAATWPPGGHRDSSRGAPVMRGVGGRRALKAACGSGAASAQLLTNGYVGPERGISDWQNILVAATLSNDVYPWAPWYKIPAIDVVQGLDAARERRWRAMFIDKWTRLGATNIAFVDYDARTGTLLSPAGHAIVLATPRDVWVTFRGTSDVGQFGVATKVDEMPWTMFNTSVTLFGAPQLSMAGLWPKLLPVVKAAVAATSDPHAARVLTTGHSLGAAAAAIGAMLMEEAGLRVGGVWAFDPYKAGTTCAAGAGERCWTSLYEERLGDKTLMVWNNGDPVPVLVDAILGTPLHNSRWGHVPQRPGGLMRVVGERCTLVGPDNAQLADACPPGLATCGLVQDHVMWEVQKSIARCALLTRRESASRLDAAAACTRSTVWTGLLNLPEPPL